MPLIAMSNVLSPFSAERGGPVYGPYFLCGWKTWSALPLPELEPWSSEQEREGAAELRLLVDEAATSDTGDFRYTLEADGTFLLQLPGLATFRVSSDAATVTISPQTSADAQLLRAHFYGSIVAVLCFRRGLLPLHGACVRLNDAAVIFTGASGAGKSTMAAAFARQGYPVLCDDVCAIDLSCNRAQVWPAFPRLKLLPDAIAAFHLDPKTLYTHAAQGEKGHFLLRQQGSNGAHTSVPLTAIYVLDSGTPDRVVVEPLRGASAFLPLKTQIHRANMGTTLGERERIFRDLACLLATVPVFQLSRPKDLARIDDVVQAIVQNSPKTGAAR